MKWNLTWRQIRQIWVRIRLKFYVFSIWVTRVYFTQDHFQGLPSGESSLHFLFLERRSIKFSAFSSPPSPTHTNKPPATIHTHTPNPPADCSGNDHIYTWIDANDSQKTSQLASTWLKEGYKSLGLLVINTQYVNNRHANKKLVNSDKIEIKKKV